MQPIEHLMVGLARTPADAGLIRYAALAAQLGAVREVRFVHVLETAADNGSARAEIEAEVRAHCRGVPETVQVHCEVHRGPLLDRLLLLTTEQERDVLLVGQHRDHPGTRALARRLAMNAPCSIWVVPEGVPAELSRILVPVDFSEHAADTLQTAVSLARQGGLAECLALHVYFNEAVVTYEGYEQVIRGEEARAFQQFMAPLDCQGVRVVPLFEEGANVAHAVGRVAEKHGADLIVMGTRGRSRSAAILLGSVTEETIVDTRVPLLVVKHYGARMGVLQALLDRDFRGRKGPRFD